MRKFRIFQEAELAIGIELLLDSSASHHLMNVLRCKIGALIFLFNGNGQEYQGTITQLSKKGVVVLLEQVQPSHTESFLHLHLGQAISRGERMDYTLQKAVELGVNEVTPLISEHSHISLSDKKRLLSKWEHWQRVIVSACEQSGRCTVPLLHPVMSLVEWLEKSHELGILLSPNGSESFQTLGKQKAFSLLAGNEGGFSLFENEYAVSKNFKSLRMGPRILRTETAALAAIACLQGMYGDFA